MASISVDAGTTVIKAVGYDGSGAEVSVVRHPTALDHRHPGWSEQDMTEVWHAVVHTVRVVAGELAGPVDHVAITAQGDGCWLVDDDGRPTGPAILWNDGRASAIVGQWRAAGVLDTAFRTNGSLGFAGLPHAILTWLQRHDPGRLARSATALTCGGWLFGQFTGRIGVDSSDAAAPFGDLAKGGYSSELLERYGMPWVGRLLPEVLDGPRRVAELSRRAAGETGLPAGTPVVLAPYDIAATAIGAGAVRPGQACAILGTTLCTEVVVERPDLTGPPTGLTVPLGTGAHLRAFPTLAGGQVIDWAYRMLGLDDTGELGELAMGSPPGANGLCVLPYLSPSGERAPFLDERARGWLTGLTFEHTRADLARAVFEGLTMVIRDCLDASGVTPEELRLCGGGAASDPWCQLIADVTGVPTARSSDRETGARGAMLMAVAATGRAPDLAGAADLFPRPRDSFRPDPDRRAGYDRLYQRFRALREVARDTWRDPRPGGEMT